MDFPPIKVFIVDDDEAVRKSLVCLLSSEFEIAGTAPSAEEALQADAVGSADVLLTDMSMPGMSGIELIAHCLSRWPKLRCLMLSANDAARDVERALKAGANGYVLKDDPAEILPAVHIVHAGLRFISPRLGIAATQRNFPSSSTIDEAECYRPTGRLKR